MQGALQQEPQWLQGQKPGTQRMNNNENEITPFPRNSTQEQPGTCGGGTCGCKLRCHIAVTTRAPAAQWARLCLLTCVTFVGVDVHRRGALRAGAGVPAGPQEAQVTAHVLARVGHWQWQEQRFRNLEDRKFVTVCEWNKKKQKKNPCRNWVMFSFWLWNVDVPTSVSQTFTGCYSHSKHTFSSLWGYKTLLHYTKKKHDKALDTLNVSGLEQ